MIHGTLIPIKTPSHHEEQYIDRHGNHSINAMWFVGQTISFCIAMHHDQEVTTMCCDIAICIKLFKTSIKHFYARLFWAIQSSRGIAILKIRFPLSQLAACRHSRLALCCITLHQSWRCNCRWGRHAVHPRTSWTTTSRWSSCNFSIKSQDTLKQPYWLTQGTLQVT